MLLNETLATELKNILTNVELKERPTTYKMVISKEVPDRDGETVIINWIDLKNYKKNPVVLLDHNYKVENIVWKTIKITTEWNQLIADFVFIDTEKGALAEKLYNAWLLKASSIWFISKQRNPNDFSIIEKSELLEWSLVAVPCNQEALSLDWKTYEEAVQKWFIIEEKKEEVTEMQEIKKELAEIKSLLKNLTDDKVKKEEIEKQEQEALEKKQILQQIDNAVGVALKNIKLLS